MFTLHLRLQTRYRPWVVYLLPTGTLVKQLSLCMGTRQIWMIYTKIRAPISNRATLTSARVGVLGHFCLTLSAPGRDIHVLVGSEKGVSSVPGREIHVHPGGSESDHFSLSKSASIGIFCRQISPLAARWCHDCHTWRHGFLCWYNNRQSEMKISEGRTLRLVLECSVTLEYLPKARREQTFFH